MQLAEPEAFKQSEEAVSGAAHHVTELPFMNILSHLSKAGVSVPPLYHYDQAAGLLYLEDFGDLTLSEACAKPVRQTLKRVTSKPSMRSWACNPGPRHPPIPIVWRFIEVSMCRS